MQQYAMNLKKIKKTFKLQHDSTDCGVACLHSLALFYGSRISMENLRELSGTNRLGTTLLGLSQAADAIGLEAKGLEAESVEDLKGFNQKAILHILTDERRSHYVIFYGYQKEQFLIGDPALGIIKMTPEALGKVWVSKALLALSPTQRLKKGASVALEKRRWIFQLVQDDFAILGVGAFLGVLTTILGLSTAFFTQKLIDQILPEKNKSLLIFGIGILILLLICRAGLAYMRDYFMLRQSVSFNNRITGLFYNKLLYLPKLFFDTHKTGEFVARLNDTARIQRTISSVASKAVIDFFVVVVSLIYIFFYTPSIVLLLLVGILLYFLLGWYYSDRLLHGQKAVMATYARNESNYIDTIQAIETIKTANRESFFSQVTQMIYGFFQEKIFQLGKIKVGFGFWAQILGVLISTAIIAWCAWLVFRERLQLGEMMAIVFVATGTVPAAIGLALLNIRLQEARVAFDRMFEFVSRPPEYEINNESNFEIKVPNTAFKSLSFENLEVRQLTFRFPGRKQLLSDVSFDLKKGEIIALVGETGSGKSITLQILQKFYNPESGRIKLNGEEWATLNPREWRRVIAVVPQQIIFFSGTVLDNILFGKGLNPSTEQQATTFLYQEVISFCKEYGFDSFFKQFPQSYATFIGEEGIQLSGGQVQLLALARALFQRPQVLILDEPIASMDRNLRTFVAGLLPRLQKQGISMIIATHRTEIVALASSVYQIKDGVSSLFNSTTDWIEQEKRPLEVVVS